MNEKNAPRPTAASPALLMESRGSTGGQSQTFISKLVRKHTHTHTQRERTASVARVYITADQCSVCPCCSKLSPIWTRICPLVLIISPRPARTRTHTLTHTRWLTVFPPRVGLFPPLAPRALRHDQLPHCRAWIRRSAWTQTQGEPLPLAAHQPRTHTHTHTRTAVRESRGPASDRLMHI